VISSTSPHEIFQKKLIQISYFYSSPPISYLFPHLPDAPLFFLLSPYPPVPQHSATPSFSSRPAPSASPPPRRSANPACSPNCRRCYLTTPPPVATIKPPPQPWPQPLAYVAQLAAPSPLGLAAPSTASSIGSACRRRPSLHVRQ
jgi:hypothetical protein